MTLPAKVTGNTALGCNVKANWRDACLNKITARIIFMPPPVLPPQVAKQAPTNIKSEAAAGHKLKSSVAKPEVEMVLITLKAATRIALIGSA